MKLISWLLLVFNLCVLSCKHEDSKFRYQKFEDFKFRPANIPANTEIQILSFSGGKVCTPDASYYYQFIGIEKSTGDTVRILTPCQTIAADINPSVGTFTPWANTGSIIDSVLHQHDEKNFISKNIFVVFNKSQKDIEEGDYKTAIGSLGF